MVMGLVLFTLTIVLSALFGFCLRASLTDKEVKLSVIFMIASGVAMLLTGTMVVLRLTSP